MAQAAGWLEIPPDHPFGLAALPYGSYTAAHHAEEYRVGVAIGDRVLDLTTATDRLLPGRAHLFRSGSLDEFLAAGDGSWPQVRADLTRWLSDETVPAGDRGPADPGRIGGPAAAVHCRGLRRLLRFGLSRHQYRPDLPAGLRAADPELETPADRLPRASRHGRGLRHPDPPAVRSVPATPARTRRHSVPCARLDFEAELGFVVGFAQPPRRTCAAPTGSPSTFSASAWSTTGPPATSSPGSTCRSARSSASPSPPRSRRGCCRSPRWSTPVSGRHHVTRSCSAT